MLNRTRTCIAILMLCVTLLGLFACAAKNSPDEPAAVRASVVDIEKFGHAVLDITTADFTAAGYELGDVVRVRLDDYEATMPFFDGYYTNPDEFLLRGFSPEDNLAICINYSDFSKEVGVTIGDIVEITIAKKADMLVLQELYALQYSNNRADYPDDVTFANFRTVTAGRIGTGKLYRTASPINNEHGRAPYAHQLIERAGVAAVLNLADSTEEIEAHFAAADFDPAYYLRLYETGNVATLDLAGNFFSDEFAASVAEGLTYLAQKEPPYCIHCTEGKDRAGYVALLLEALMGAELDEIIDDYMLTFYNYYGIDPENEPERYEAVLNTNLMPVLFHVTGADTREALAQVDLEAAVTEYLLRAGMAEADIIALKEKLH